MNTDRIKEIQKETAYPESVSVQQALLKVWNETEQEQLHIGAVIGSFPMASPEKIFERLVKLYPDNYVCVAKICDEVLDRSGALLCEVRKAARK